MSIPVEYQSRRTPQLRIAVMTVQTGDTHETVARVLSLKFDFEAHVIADGDPVTTAMAVRDCQALVVIGAPTNEDMSGPAIEEAVSAMIPIIALCSDASAQYEIPPGISYALDPALGPEHLATALRALAGRQLEIQRLQSDALRALSFSGGLRNEINNIQDELLLAASVQREFLPRQLPTLGGLHSAVLWRPAAYVSGDIYNVIRLDEHHLGFFVIDAVGHGVPAALLTLVISRGLITKEISGNAYRILSPGEALTRVNDEMLSRAGRMTRFATAIYAVIDTRNHRLTVASAGHPPMLRMRRGGQCQAVATYGGLLGVFEKEVFAEESIDLELGDRLFFYTDGFEQAFPELGHDPAAPRLPNRRFIDIFNEFSTLQNPVAVIQQLEMRLDEERDLFPQIDDLTLLCVGWT